MITQGKKDPQKLQKETSLDVQTRGISDSTYDNAVNMFLVMFHNKSMYIERNFNFL